LVSYYYENYEFNFAEVHGTLLVRNFAKIRKIKIKGKYFVKIFSFCKEKNCQNLENKIGEKIATLD